MTGMIDVSDELESFEVFDEGDKVRVLLGDNFELMVSGSQFQAMVNELSKWKPLEEKP